MPLASRAAVFSQTHAAVKGSGRQENILYVIDPPRIAACDYRQRSLKNKDKLHTPLTPSSSLLLFHDLKNTENQSRVVDKLGLGVGIVFLIRWFHLSPQDKTQDTKHQ